VVVVVVEIIGQQVSQVVLILVLQEVQVIMIVVFQMVHFLVLEVEEWEVKVEVVHPDRVVMVVQVHTTLLLGFGSVQVVAGPQNPWVDKTFRGVLEERPQVMVPRVVVLL
jgi:hypothetical protein